MAVARAGAGAVAKVRAGLGVVWAELIKATDKQQIINKHVNIDPFQPQCTLALAAFLFSILPTF